MSTTRVELLNYFNKIAITVNKNNKIDSTV